MLRDNFWLDGENAASFGIRLQREVEFEAAEPNVETVKVPGRNGDLHYFDGAFENIKGTASCYCLDKDVSLITTSVNAWLMKSLDYRRLETLIEPQFFRLARVTHGATLKPRLNKLNAFDIEFDCKPFKYYKSGEEAKTFTEAGTITNPSAFAALPLIVVHGSGSGTVTINGSTLTLTDCNEVTLDCETKDAYKGTTNKNSTVSGTYPTLEGTSEVSFTGGVTRLTITPRWWTL